MGGYGPLPAATVRSLGARLARALEQVHRAGLIHRDVKPGNVLLAADGPWLIDFGIARAAGATTLTAVNTIVGTPGYLAPELARAGSPAPDPASDVFSLGCVLAYAATGHGPFGGGHPAAVVFRTVHDEPELDGLPDELREPVTACLAKDPAARPTLAQLLALLGEGRAEEPGAHTEDWLPAPLLRLIAERSTRALDLPAPEPTRIDVPPARRPLTRRRLLAAGEHSPPWARRSPGSPRAGRPAGPPRRPPASSPPTPSPSRPT